MEWAEQDVHKGVLSRCKDYPFSREKFNDLVAKDHRLADAWLIDEGAKVQMTQYTGYHVYSPVAGAGRRIWVQVPLEQEGDWETQAGDELTGVWLPAGSNAFAPDEPDARPGETAVLQWGDWHGADTSVTRPARSGRRSLSAGPAWPCCRGSCCSSRPRRCARGKRRRRPTKTTVPLIPGVAKHQPDGVGRGRFSPRERPPMSRWRILTVIALLVVPVLILAALRLLCPLEGLLVGRLDLGSR